MRTLGDVQRSPGYMLWASCPTCGRYKTLDINALAQRFGRKAQVDRLKRLHRAHRDGMASCMRDRWFRSIHR